MFNILICGKTTQRICSFMLVYTPEFIYLFYIQKVFSGDTFVANFHFHLQVPQILVLCRTFKISLSHFQNEHTLVMFFIEFHVITLRTEVRCSCVLHIYPIRYHLASAVDNKFYSTVISKKKKQKTNRIQTTMKTLFCEWCIFMFVQFCLRSCSHYV